MDLNPKLMRNMDNAPSLRQGDQPVNLCASYLTACFYACSPERLRNPLKGSVHTQLPGLKF